MDNRKWVVKQAKMPKLVKYLHCTFSFRPCEEFWISGFLNCRQHDFLLFISCSGADVEASDHPSLALGSHIAAELREAIHSKLGLTGCAGIATNKLLAKLVSGSYKPNQQTTLLPENVSDIMGCLSSLRKVPGVDVQLMLNYLSIQNSCLGFFNRIMYPCWYICGPFIYS